MTDLGSSLTELIELALDTLRRTAPHSLEKMTQSVAEPLGVKVPESFFSDIVQNLITSSPNGRLLHALTMAIQSWDHAPDSDWARGTQQHSLDRRMRVLALLGFKGEDQEEINRRIPRYTESDFSIVIAENHEPWYEERKRQIRNFYWSHYQEQLSPPNGKWSSHAMGVLDVSIDDVISRLSDPTRKDLYAVKGLVMGYVQSGKTSHFSGLITKAADAGYRMFIVLAGTLDVLRRQTQRRIDKDIIGKEILGPDEYGTDKDWSLFVSHGGRPSSHLLGSFDWERLTNWDHDYKTLSDHLSILEFRSKDHTKPFNDPENLRFADARIAVIKKVPARLNKLCDDLEDLKRLRAALSHVPTLIIDDESDQASINTIDQDKPGKKGDRTKTNKAIGRLLKLLPRAQYVGYTATPFANVFIDPEDAEDLFPKDFVVSLPRPVGYMGVSDFFDFDRTYPEGDFNGNKNAFVRPVEGDNENAMNLPKALDSFVLSGAIKLFRQSCDPHRYRFQHHTMLVHHSATQVVHESDREKVERLFGGGARYHSSKGKEELRALFEHDFVPVAVAKAEDEPMPASFEDLVPFISECLTKICADKPVRIVNGDNRRRDETPDFEQGDVWAILVGGTKLSRGYTVEGLTISYYRRPAGAGDTLMQMGRWFGFRPGYRDLVRLFIGQKEPKGKVTVDLYEAFKAVCLDEEALRSDLLKYSREGLVPRQVPPLVHQHMATLPVTAKNKRFNAEILAEDFAGAWTEKTSAPSEQAGISRNLDLARGLLSGATLSPLQEFTIPGQDRKGVRIRALMGVVPGYSALEFLRSYRWADNRRSVLLECNYIEAELHHGRLMEWQVFLPQTKPHKDNRLRMEGLPELATISRSRVSASRFGVYSDPTHRKAAEYMAGRWEVADPSPSIALRRRPDSPVLVLYFVHEENSASGDQSDPSVGFGIQYPGVPKGKGIVWSVRDRANGNAIVVSG